MSGCTFHSEAKSTIGTPEIMQSAFRNELQTKPFHEVIEMAKPDFVYKEKDITTVYYHYTKSNMPIINRIPVISLLFSMFITGGQEWYTYKNYYTSLTFDKNGKQLSYNFTKSKKNRTPGMRQRLATRETAYLNGLAQYPIIAKRNVDTKVYGDHKSCVYILHPVFYYGLPCINW